MAKNNIYINETAVSTADRSFFYGDGCFTTIAKINGRLLLLDKHISRLKNDTDKLKIPWKHWQTLQMTLENLAKQSIEDSVLKVLISRGQGGRGYMPPKEQHPVIYISSHPLTQWSHKKPLVLGIAETPIVEHPSLAGLKHNNRLNQILAKQELIRHKESAHAFDDLLLCNQNGQIIEAISANFFAKINGNWYTPDLRFQGVAGVMREYLLEILSKSGVNIIVAELPISALGNVEAGFITNAVMGLQTIAKIVHDDMVIDLDIESANQIDSLLRSSVELSCI